MLTIPFFWFLIIASCISIGIILYGTFEQKSNIQGFGFILFLLILLFGWGFLGNILPLKSGNFKSKGDVVLGKNVAFITINDNIVLTINTIKEFNYVKDKKTVEIGAQININLYNTTVGSPVYSLLMEETPN